MAATLSPDQEENRSQLPEEDTPDFLRQSETPEPSAGTNNQPAGGPGNAISNISKYENQVGAGYRGSNPLKDLQPSSKGVWVFARKNRGKLIIGGSIAGFITLLIVGFLILIPFKLLHIVNNIQEHFMATPNDAVERVVERSFQTYLQKHVRPALTNCGRTIHPGCRVTVPAGGNPVTALYRGWGQARLEKKLAEKGVVFGFRNGVYYLDVKGKGQIDITDFMDGRTGDLFNSRGFTSSKEFRNAYKQALKTALKEESRWNRTLIRFKANRLVRLKTGLPACVFLCDPRDDFRDWRQEQKRKAYRLARVPRILAPRDEMTKLVIECLFNPRECSMELRPGQQFRINRDPNTNSGRVISDSAEGGKPTSQFETKLRVSALTGFHSIGGPNRTSSSWAPDAEKKLNELEEYRTWTRYAVAKLIKDALIKSGVTNGERQAKEIARRISGAIPYVGWLLFLTSLADTIDYVADHSGQIGYLVNSTTMLAEWQSLVTLVHECKEGRCDAEALGSAVKMLEPCLEDPDACDVGGTAGAEQSPVYGEILGSQGITASTSSLLPSFFGVAKAQQPEYTCGQNEDPQPLPAGKLACPEERLDQITPAQKVRNEIRQHGGYAISTAIAIGGAWNWVIDKILGFAGLVCKAPLVCDLAEAAIRRGIDAIPGIDHITGFMGDLFNKYFMPKNPDGLNPSGGRQFQLAAGGADKMANDVAHNTLGGSKLEQSQVNQIVRQQQEQKLAEYKSKSFIARMFDSESPYSPVSKFAMAMPSSFSSAINRVTSFLSNNPLSGILNSFATVPAIAGGTASAARDLTEDPWGITQYGYLPSNPIFQEDPEKYYQENCMTTAKTDAWNQKAADYANRDTDDNITKQPENLFDPNDKYHGTNPCLLIWASVGSAGAIYTDEVLSPEEVNEPVAGGGGGGIIDCANAGDPSTWPDWSPGTPPDFLRPFIEAQAPGRDCTDAELVNSGFTTPSNAVPNDGLRQYFAYEGCGDLISAGGCFVEHESDGRAYVNVKFRHPPGSNNTAKIYLDGAGGGGPPSPSPGPSPPPAPPPCRGDICPD